MKSSVKIDAVNEVIHTSVSLATATLEGYSKNATSTENILKDISKVNQLSNNTKESVETIKNGVDELQAIV